MKAKVWIQQRQRHGMVWGWEKIFIIIFPFFCHPIQTTCVIPSYTYSYSSFVHTYFVACGCTKSFASSFLVLNLSRTKVLHCIFVHAGDDDDKG